MKPLRLILATVASVLLAACQTGGGGSSAAGSAGRFIVSTERTAFYERGPAQDYGPDFNLTKGQEVEMVERNFGFSRVRTSLGKVGYVSTDDLQVAPPAPEPTPEPSISSSSSVSRSGSRSSSSSSSQTIDYSDVVTDLPVPEEEPKPVTSFRY